jgi:hypothetical protein
MRTRKPLAPRREGGRYFFAGAGTGRVGSCNGIVLPPGSEMVGPFTGAGPLAGAFAGPVPAGG